MYIHPMGLETFLLEWLKRGRTPYVEPDPLAGRSMLTYSRRYRGTVLVFALFCIGILSLGYIGRREVSGTMLALYYILFCALSSVFFYAMWEAFRNPIAFSEEGIFVGSAGTFVPWSAITEVR